MTEEHDSAHCEHCHHEEAEVTLLSASALHRLGWGAGLMAFLWLIIGWAIR